MPQTTPTVVMPIPYNSTAINVTWAPVEETREKIRGELLGYRVCKSSFICQDNLSCAQ